MVLNEKLMNLLDSIQGIIQPEVKENLAYAIAYDDDCPCAGGCDGDGCSVDCWSNA